MEQEALANAPALLLQAAFCSTNQAGRSVKCVRVWSPMTRTMATFYCKCFCSALTFHWMCLFYCCSFSLCFSFSFAVVVCIVFLLCCLLSTCRFCHQRCLSYRAAYASQVAALLIRKVSVKEGGGQSGEKGMNWWIFLVVYFAVASERSMWRESFTDIYVRFKMYLKSYKLF